MAWKYVNLQVGNYQFPIIFPDKMVHRDTAVVVAQMLAGFGMQVTGVVSAGTIEHLDPIGVGGESTTLGIQSKGSADEAMIRTYSYMHGVSDVPDDFIERIGAQIHEAIKRGEHLQQPDSTGPQAASGPG